MYYTCIRTLNVKIPSRVVSRPNKRPKTIRTKPVYCYNIITLSYYNYTPISQVLPTFNIYIHSNETDFKLNTIRNVF